MKTRAWLACLALGVLCLTGSSPAEAREYPSKPITLVNPFGAGSSADIVVRLVEPFIKIRTISFSRVSARRCSGRAILNP